MKTINYVSIPSTIEEDINQGKTTWRSGKCVSIDEGNSVTLYIGHRSSVGSLSNKGFKTC